MSASAQTKTRSANINSEDQILQELQTIDMALVLKLLSIRELKEHYNT
jgi:hypothetical protein